jgi:hypothetical protein
LEISAICDLIDTDSQEKYKELLRKHTRRTRSGRYWIGERMVDYRARFDAELRDIYTSFLDIQRGNRDRVYPLHSAALHGRPVSLLLLLGPEVDHYLRPC